jgi:hypothetical protein
VIKIFSGNSEKATRWCDRDCGSSCLGSLPSLGKLRIIESGDEWSSSPYPSPPLHLHTHPQTLRAILTFQ